jgi:DNA-binding beta-propeller fold protein YncE
MIGDIVTDFTGDPELALPPFPQGHTWLNVSAPLTLDDLRGKIVILNFWTAGSINCQHMFPVLAQMQANYPAEMVVISVHSPKFPAVEAETVIQRQAITHPILLDQDMAFWYMLGIHAWPSFVVVDPLGHVLAAQSGEIPFDPFNTLIEDMIAFWDQRDGLDRAPLEKHQPAEPPPADTVLRFPGKVCVDGAAGRLFIADTDHHRVIVADLETHAVRDVIGCGQPGYADGDFAAAALRAPQGMAVHGEALYIADTGNHAVRVADLATRQVDVLAGTGEMDPGRPLPFGTPVREPRAFPLRSPWDLALGAGHTLFIANAGGHQVFELNLETEVLRASVGNGREALKNLTPETSELAQPSGLYFQDGLLYIADAGSSTVRVADYTNSTVLAVSGPLEDTLFTFGASDGPVGQSRLQHPLDVTGDGAGTLYVADTFNHTIRVVDSRMVTDTLGQYASMPGGLDYHAGRLYVADTGAHAIRMIDVASGAMHTVELIDPDNRL